MHVSGAHPVCDPHDWVPVAATPNHSIPITARPVSLSSHLLEPLKCWAQSAVQFSHDATNCKLPFIVSLRHCSDNLVLYHFYNAIATWKKPPRRPVFTASYLMLVRKLSSFSSVHLPNKRWESACHDHQQSCFMCYFSFRLALEIAGIFSIQSHLLINWLFFIWSYPPVVCCCQPKSRSLTGTMVVMSFDANICFILFVCVKHP